jgi:hypothetical protein
MLVIQQKCVKWQAVQVHSPWLWQKLDSVPVEVLIAFHWLYHKSTTLWAWCLAWWLSSDWYLTGIQVFHAKDQHNALFSCVSNFNPCCISQICLCMLHASCWWNVMLSNSERWLECNINSYTTSKGLLNWYLIYHRAHDTYGWRWTARSLKQIAYCVDPDFAGTSKCCCIGWCF